MNAQNIQSENRTAVKDKVIMITRANSGIGKAVGLLNGSYQVDRRFKMSNTQLRAEDLWTQRRVITSRDHETCPTNKSNKAINNRIVVKFDANLRSLETGRDPSDHDNYEPLENHSIGVLPHGQ